MARRLGLIVSNKTFLDRWRHIERPGSHRDAVTMQAQLVKFGFVPMMEGDTTMVHKDVTRDDLLELMKRAAGQTNVDLFFIMILSYGKDGDVVCHDSEFLEIDRILELFHDSSSGKKMVFFMSDYHEDTCTPRIPIQTFSTTKFPPETVLQFSPVTGFLGWLRKRNGRVNRGLSYFVESVCKAINKESSSELRIFFERVHEEYAKILVEEEIEQCEDFLMPEVRSSLTEEPTYP
ncbi:uncharacterized protein LOC117336709 [Pecten maximus]|uniref:uncharacterized protein LOC117336709 n=1 Tax=Pecten maximus TaxID=6579 RepID=UPI001457F42C|nr:uncharacterized protein LOC117336709 [Pecten maximus]